MGFFDFLHGVSNQKSEAELYMEQRNKEYTRRAAEYKRKETLAASFNDDSFLGKLLPQNKTTMLNAPRKNNYTQYSQTHRAQQPRTTQSYQTHAKLSRITRDCDTCGTSKSLFDNDKLDIFSVENAFAKANTRTVTASGKVVRGGFSVGDKVTVKTTLEEREVSIQQIFRQGEAINYANTSSGKVAIVLSNAADIMVRSGDQITKKK